VSTETIRISGTIAASVHLQLSWAGIGEVFMSWLGRGEVVVSTVKYVIPTYFLGEVVGIWHWGG